MSKLLGVDEKVVVVGELREELKLFFVQLGRVERNGTDGSHFDEKCVVANVDEVF